MMLNGWYDYLFGSTTTTTDAMVVNPQQQQQPDTIDNNVHNNNKMIIGLSTKIDESQENIIMVDDATALDAIALPDEIVHPPQKHHHRVGCNHKILGVMIGGANNHNATVGDDDWIFVDDGRSSGRSSPVLVASPEIVELDDGASSVVTTAGPPPPSAPAIMATSSCNSAASVEQLRAARALAVQRRAVADKLYAGSGGDESTSMPTTTDNQSSVMITSVKLIDKLTHASRLKRVTLAVTNQQAPTDGAKTKSRSKKYKQLQTGRNNDRKCQY
jgi:hypothetical protein